MTPIHYQSGAISAGDCISQAWALVTRQFGLYLGVGLITIILVSCVPIVNFFLMGPIFGGFYYLVLRDLRDEPVDFGMLFKGFDKFVPLMVAGLVQGAPSIIATIIQYTVDTARLIGIQRGSDVNFFQSTSDIAFAGISAAVVIFFVVFFFFAIAWHLAFSFAVPLIIDQDIEVGEALMTSVKAALSNAGGLILLIILQILVTILGVLALCFGVFVAIPVIYAANAIAYRQVFPDFGRPGFNPGPPPPDSYNFGRAA